MSYKYINLVLIVIGIIIGFYGSNQNPKNEIFLVAGIILIMIAVYRISKTIPSKADSDEDR